MTDTAKRIRKLLEREPDMTDAQIARKIGRDNLEGWARVAQERKAAGFFKDCDEILDDKET